MKKLLLACIISIGFAQQLTANIYDIIADLFRMQRAVEQMREKELQKKLEKVENLSLDYKNAKALNVGNALIVPAFTNAMWNVRDYQIKRQNKIFEKNVQMMNMHKMNRE